MSQSESAAATAIGRPDVARRPRDDLPGRQGRRQEQYSGEALLVTAYAALWVVIFAWVALVWRKQSALMALRLDDLERVIDDAADEAATGK